MPRRPHGRFRGEPVVTKRAVCFVVGDEGPVIGARGVAADLGQLVRREEPFVQWKAAAFERWHEPDDARVSRPDL